MTQTKNAFTLELTEAQKHRMLGQLLVKADEPDLAAPVRALVLQTAMAMLDQLSGSVRGAGVRSALAQVQAEALRNAA